MQWTNYVKNIDDSHQMTTDKNHIEKLCEIVSGRPYKILELGSHAGISTAALALASPKSSIDSVDLCDTISEPYRVNYWNSLNITNIVPFSCSTQEFLDKNTNYYDFIFHDAMHGSRAMGEYLTCTKMCDTLAIHDFEQLSQDEMHYIIHHFKCHLIDSDIKNRMLFIGFKK